MNESNKHIRAGADYHLYPDHEPVQTTGATSPIHNMPGLNTQFVQILI